MNTIVCIGDSLTFGRDWLNGSDLAQPLNVRLAEHYPGLNVVNLGVNGNTTTNIDARKAEADAYSPFRVIVWAGINDIYNGATESQIKNSLQSIYDYYHLKGYEVWAITITPKDDDDSSKNTIRTNVNAWITNTATSVDRVIDAWTAIRDPNDTTQRLAAYADPNTENHINDAGMAAIVSLFP